MTIPKSTKEHRIKENASVFDFELTQDDMNRIDALNENLRVGPDPDNFYYAQLLMMSSSCCLVSSSVPLLSMT